MPGYPDEFTDLLLSLHQSMVNEESLDDTLRRVAYLACKSPIDVDTAGVTLQREGARQRPPSTATPRSSLTAYSTQAATVHA